MYSIGRLFEHEVVIIFLCFSLNMCFGCSKEPAYLKKGNNENGGYNQWLGIS